MRLSSLYYVFAICCYLKTVRMVVSTEIDLNSCFGTDVVSGMVSWDFLIA